MQLSVVVPSLAPVLALFSFIAFFAAVPAYFVWFYKTWSLLPQSVLQKTPPGVAVVYAIIPGLNLWWFFASNKRIGRALALSLATHPTRVRAPTHLAWIGPALVVLIVVSACVIATVESRIVSLTMPLLMLVPFVWFAWMLRVDNCNAELAFHRRRKAREKSGGPQRVP
jgi:hypothetical protein